MEKSAELQEKKRDKRAPSSTKSAEVHENKTDRSEEGFALEGNKGGMLKRKKLGVDYASAWEKTRNTEKGLAKMGRDFTTDANIYFLFCQVFSRY